jgi:hypothetical protein
MTVQSGKGSSRVTRLSAFSMKSTILEAAYIWTRLRRILMTRKLEKINENWYGPLRGIKVGDSVVWLGDGEEYVVATISVACEDPIKIVIGLEGVYSDICPGVLETFAEDRFDKLG